MDFWTLLVLTISCICTTSLALPSATGHSLVRPAAGGGSPHDVPVAAAVSGVRRKRQSSAEVSQSVRDEDHPRHIQVVRNSNGTLGIVVLDGPSTAPATTAGPAPSGVRDVLLASPDTADISFPNDTDTRTFVPAKCDNGLTFCEEVPNYPLDLIEAVISREGHRFSELFGRDVLNEDPSLANRFSGINESTMCDSTRQVIYPKTGMTKENDWMYIVNSDKFQQGVLVEQCTKPDDQCNFTKSFPLGYRTRCKQMYIYRQLLSVNSDGITEKNMFQIPSCCQCVVSEQ